jgi:hypothetical protein
VFLEDAEISGSSQRREVNLEEIRTELPVPMTQETTPIIHELVPEVSAPPPQATSIEIPVENPNVQINEPQQDETIVENEIQAHEPSQPQPVVIPNELVRRSQQERRFAIPDYYETYLSEDLYDIGKVDDPSSFKEAIAHKNSDKWIEAMQDELKSMSTNQVYDLVEIPNGVKLVGCK